MMLLSLSYALAGPNPGPPPTLRATAQSTAPSVQGPALVQDDGHAVPVRIIAGMPGGVWVDGCAPVEMEHREADTWVALPSTVCGGTTPASRVQTELTIAVPPPPAGEYRAVIAWGAGCAEGVPFELAGCKTLGVARSAAFPVSGPAAGATKGADGAAAPSTPANP